MCSLGLTAQAAGNNNCFIGAEYKKRSLHSFFVWWRKLGGVTSLCHFLFNNVGSLLVQSSILFSYLSMTQTLLSQARLSPSRCPFVSFPLSKSVLISKYPTKYWLCSCKGVKRCSILRKIWVADEYLLPPLSPLPPISSILVLYCS